MHYQHRGPSSRPRNDHHTVWADRGSDWSWWPEIAMLVMSIAIVAWAVSL